MDDTDAPMSIGAFARRVGLAPSALRFYDDCDVLRPAYVDGATGYRYYLAGQEARAVLVRRLREAGMPLTEASAVLEGSHEEALAVLEEHAARTRRTAASAQSAIEEILRDMGALGTGAPGERVRTRAGVRVHARVGGAELASAVRQVAPAVAPASVREEFPVLGCVLIELDGQEVRLVATDRYRLAVRTLRPSSVEGGSCRVLVGASEMKDLAAWALRLPEVTLEVDERGARLLGEWDTRAVLTVDETFPDYQLILDDLPPAQHRAIVDRAALRSALVVSGEGGPGPVVLRTEEGTEEGTGARRLTLVSTHESPLVDRGAANASLPALCTGAPLRIAFDPAVMLAALDAGVGPDVLLEISSPTRPVVVRSADQGSFTTLVMPVQDARADAPAAT
ncbi:MerR family transcriptional regulator [Streptomyces sp. NBC_01187]|uniref:DNA polymerase III subunit beta family protein n=1 Tax=Streptomyces sp. NBC_01187 TaxID=2903766 RepID=UPI003862EB29|nr:MerR family transcriptional regulator [Streptomyces sp. NBC_01187]